MTGRYREAGVDLDAARKAVDLIREVASGAALPGVVEGVGGFAGLFRLDDGRLLAAAADGVGTKMEVARLAGRLDSIGIDLVAMCVNDLVCTGAEPLFFLDYLAVGKVVPEQVRDLVAGVAEGCRRSGCALLGGETAEHPGTMDEGQFDLAGFAVGIVDEDRLIGPSLVRDGDVLIGLASSGLHSNGYSLARKALLEDAGVSLNDTLPGLDRPLGDELLEPTLIYADVVLQLAREGLINAAAHITGGGLVENVPRVLPDGLGAEIDLGSWDVPPIFKVVQEASGASDEEMREVFNLGVGMVLVGARSTAEQALSDAESAGYRAWPLGRVEPDPGIRFAAE
jgi:phosphoribosylformylglycinamidine cyclo-ligase